MSAGVNEQHGLYLIPFWVERSEVDYQGSLKGEEVAGVFARAFAVPSTRLPAVLYTYTLAASVRGLYVMSYAGVNYQHGICAKGLVRSCVWFHPFSFSSVHIFLILIFV